MTFDASNNFVGPCDSIIANCNFCHLSIIELTYLNIVVFLRKVLTYDSSRTLSLSQIVFNIARSFSAFWSLFCGSTAVTIFFCQPSKISFNSVNSCKKKESHPKEVSIILSSPGFCQNSAFSCFFPFY